MKEIEKTKEDGGSRYSGDEVVQKQMPQHQEHVTFLIHHIPPRYYEERYGNYIAQKTRIIRKEYLLQMAYYQYHFMRFLSNQFLQRSRYMDIDISHNAYKSITQFIVSSHQLEIKASHTSYT